MTDEDHFGVIFVYHLLYENVVVNDCQTFKIIILEEYREMKGTVIGYCEICGKQFVKYREYHVRCSAECREIATEKLQYYQKTRIVEKQCLHCFETFKTNDAKRRYCSDDCYKAHRLATRTRVKPTKRVCAVCSAEFQSAHGSKKYCSHDCYVVAKKERQRV